MTPSAKSGTPSPRLAGFPRRWAEADGFVGLWMALGWVLSLETNAYLLLGVPLTVLFQLGVCRQPIRALWVHEAPRFRLGWKGLVIALGLAVLPSAIAVGSFLQRDWFIALWAVAAVVGACGVGYSLVQFRRSTWRLLAGCLLWAGGLGMAYMLIMAWWEQGYVAPQIWVFGPTLLTLFPVCFVVEEVSFRGTLDVHVCRASDAAPFASALFVSCLWGLWHLPLYAEVGLADIGRVLLLHALVGVPLSLFWRQSGNLAVPAFAHAWVDAVRDCLVAGASG